MCYTGVSNLFTNTSISTSMLIGCGPPKIEFTNFSDGILEQVGTVCHQEKIFCFPSAKQQPSNVKHGSGIRPYVWVLTFAPPPLYFNEYTIYLSPRRSSFVELQSVSNKYKVL